MITDITPLAEVASLLPKNSADMLLAEGDTVRERCLMILRSHMAHWDREEISLDPIAWATVVDGITVTLITMTKRILALDLALQTEAILHGKS